MTRRPYPSAYLTANARRLRHEQTDAEALLWRVVRNRALAGYRFRRRFPIGDYIADFCCFEERLVIEVDGGQHAIEKADDDSRTQFLTSGGYRVIRFWNNDVLANLEGVAATILEELTREPSPQPSPEGRRG